MLEPLFGEVTTQVLLSMQVYKEDYARRMAARFGLSLSAVQRQLEKLERAGVLTSHLLGRTRLYRWNPRYPFGPELHQLLDKAMSFVSEKDREKYYMERSRPRRAGKPL